MRLTGRSAEMIELTEKYCKVQGLFRSSGTPTPQFTDSLELDLNQVETSLAGPKRPQDLIPLKSAKQLFATALTTPTSRGGYELDPYALSKKARINGDGKGEEISH